jgi:hypothetical protein
MKGQSEQIKIQQLNNWFNRNIQTVQTIKKSIFQNNDGNVNSIAEIYYQLNEDIRRHENYFHLYDEMKDILEISIHMEEYLDEQYNIEKEKIIKDSITNIKKEFTILFQNEFRNIKGILTVVYFLIALNKKVVMKIIVHIVIG